MAYLRAFRTTDLDALLEVHNAAAAPEAGQLPTSRAALEKAWRGGDLWVAEVEGRVVGYGGLRPWPGAGWLQAELVVHPTWRGQGVGGTLLRRLVREARRRGATDLAAVAGDGPEGSNRFLAHYGFELYVLRQHMRLWPVVVPAVEPVAGFGVRPAALAESAALADISNAAYGPGDRTGLADAAGYRRYIIESGVRVWVAERLEGPRLVALCEVRERETALDGRPVASGHIASLAVHPAWQGRGLGRWLLVTGIEDCRRTGWPTVELNVDRDNVPALRLYESAGFRPVYRYAVYRLHLGA